MSLINKIKNIENPPLSNTLGNYGSGSHNTIDEFFDYYIKPKLPQPCVVRKWHTLLMDYTDEANFNTLSCCLRYGNNGSAKPSVHGESGYYKLRRGWLTKNVEDEFEFFYADNFFSSFIYKMALDGYCPSIKEFRDAFLTHSFPYGFGFMVDKKVNEFKGVVVATASEPGFLGEYKLSHIFDAGNNFEVNGDVYSGKYADQQLSLKYYDIGHSNDFLSNPNKVRKMTISNDAKKVIVAKFLRFAHPFNYFLTPSKKKHSCAVKVYKNDIGEDPRMISYVKAYLKKTYPTEYREFLDRIMWYQDPNEPKPNGSVYIGIHYDINNVNRTVTTIKNKSTGKKGKGHSNSNNPVNSKSSAAVQTNGTCKIGELARTVLRAILESGKASKAEIKDMLTFNYSKVTFGLQYPLLVKSGSTFDAKRYYVKPLTIYNKDYYLCSQWFETKANNDRPLLEKWIKNHP